MNGFEALLLVGLLVILAVTVWRASSARQWQLDLETYRLTFPLGLQPVQVTAFFNGVAGIVGSRLQRLVLLRAVAIEMVASADGIEHRLRVPKAYAGTVLATLRATLPGVAATPLEAAERPRPTLVAAFAMKDRRRPLAVERSAEISTAILSALQPLAAGEEIAVQWVASPTGPARVIGKPKPPVRLPRHSGFWGLYLSVLEAGINRNRFQDPQDLAAARAKQTSALFAATGRIGIVASDPRRARGLLRQVLAAHHMANAPGAHLFRRRLPSNWLTPAFAGCRLPVVHYPATLNAAELGALVAMPVGHVSLPGLRLGGCRPLAPASDIPSGGRVLGRATFPGAERPVALSVTDSLRHLHVIGPTGVGKSTMLTGLIQQDMAAGRGVIVLDPKGDLVADVLDRVPPSRIGDVVVLDPTDDERPVGLNLLAGAADDPELVVDQLVGTLHQLWAAFWGPRTDDILRAALLTLVHEPGMTLCEIPLLLTDPVFRRRVVGRLDDPIALEPFWGWFEGLSDAERAQAIGPVMNKLRSFLLRRRLRNVLGQADSPLDFDQVLAERKILLVPLAKGLLGEEAAALVGSLVVARLWQAVQRRAGVPAVDRPAAFAYIDEFQDYLHLPTDVADVLAQARGLGLGLTLAHQHLGQLPQGLRKAILANARSRVMFQMTADDARTFAKELAPHLAAADLQGLDAFQTVMTLSAGSRIAPPVTAATELPPPPTGMAAEARERSRQVYGADRVIVEAALRARHEGRRPAGSVGRREVPS
jgi:hypothetical protein